MEMSSPAAVEALGALAQEHRLALFRLLVQAGEDGMPAGAIAEALEIPNSSLSFHLAHLSRAGLIGQRREGRSLIYSADYSAMNALVGFLLENCCGGEDCTTPAPKEGTPMRDPYNVLFLCTGNSARSVLGEALLNKLGEGRFRAFSAGSDPKGAVHPLTIEVLDSFGYPTADLHSKNWDVFTGPDAPEFDFIFTVCDNAAGESCPVWPGKPLTAHWGVEDPAAVEGDGQRAAFVDALSYLKRRIELFLMLPHAGLDELAMKGKLATIGREAGASARARAAE